jgi:hypothetical protein
MSRNEVHVRDLRWLEARWLPRSLKGGRAATAEIPAWRPFSVSSVVNQETTEDTEDTEKYADRVSA